MNYMDLFKIEIFLVFLCDDYIEAVGVETAISLQYVCIHISQLKRF